MASMPSSLLSLGDMEITMTVVSAVGESVVWSRDPGHKVRSSGLRGYSGARDAQRKDRLSSPGTFPKTLGFEQNFQAR